MEAILGLLHSNIRNFLGYPIDQQVKSLERCIPTVVVGTPGRINDLVQRKKLDLSKVKFFVVDECDRVLTELSMRRDVQSIYKMTPADRQVMMFSATLNKDVRKTCEMFCRNVRYLLCSFCHILICVILFSLRKFLWMMMLS